MGAPRVLLQITGVGRAAGGVTFNVKVAMESGPCKEVQCFFPLGPGLWLCCIACPCVRVRVFTN